jgi:hypothetical protein
LSLLDVTVWLIDGKLYMLFALSLDVFLLADTVHSFSHLDFHPWRIDGLVVLMEIEPGGGLLLLFHPDGKTSCNFGHFIYTDERVC